MNYCGGASSRSSSSTICGLSAASGPRSTTCRYRSRAAPSPGCSGPSGLRQDDADAQHRRHADHRRTARVTVLGLPAGSADLRNRVGYMPQDPTIYDDLRVIDNVRYFASLYGTDARPPTKRLRPSASKITELLCAATSPAVNELARRWPARWCRARTCWCSTNPPSASTPYCGSICGSSSTNWPGAGPHCWCRATSWTRPITAAICC